MKSDNQRKREAICGLMAKFWSGAMVPADVNIAGHTLTLERYGKIADVGDAAPMAAALRAPLHDVEFFISDDIPECDQVMCVQFNDVTWPWEV